MQVIALRGKRCGSFEKRSIVRAISFLRAANVGLPPKPIRGERSQARPVGETAGRSVGNRKERRLWRDYASSLDHCPQTPSSLRAKIRG